MIPMSRGCSNADGRIGRVSAPGMGRHESARTGHGDGPSSVRRDPRRATNPMGRRGASPGRGVPGARPGPLRPYRGRPRPHLPGVRDPAVDRRITRPGRLSPRFPTWCEPLAHQFAVDEAMRSASRTALGSADDAAAIPPGSDTIPGGSRLREPDAPRSIDGYELIEELYQNMKNRSSYCSAQRSEWGTRDTIPHDTCSHRLLAVDSSSDRTARRGLMGIE
jgi:hypothetical protein